VKPRRRLASGTGDGQHEGVDDLVVRARREGVDNLNLVCDPGVRAVDDARLRLAPFHVMQRHPDVTPA
jgi:hypothetical protein